MLHLAERFAEHHRQVVHAGHGVLLPHGHRALLAAAQLADGLVEVVVDARYFLVDETLDPRLPLRKRKERIFDQLHFVHYALLFLRKLHIARTVTHLLLHLLHHLFLAEGYFHQVFENLAQGLIIFCILLCLGRCHRFAHLVGGFLQFLRSRFLVLRCLLVLPARQVVAGLLHLLACFFGFTFRRLEIERCFQFLVLAFQLFLLFLQGFEFFVQLLLFLLQFGVFAFGVFGFFGEFLLPVCQALHLLRQLIGLLLHLQLFELFDGHIQLLFQVFAVELHLVELLLHLVFVELVEHLAELFHHGLHFGRGHFFEQFAQFLFAFQEFLVRRLQFLLLAAQLFLFAAQLFHAFLHAHAFVYKLAELVFVFPGWVLGAVEFQLQFFLFARLFLQVAEGFLHRTAHVAGGLVGAFLQFIQAFLLQFGYRCTGGLAAVYGVVVPYLKPIFDAVAGCHADGSGVDGEAENGIAAAAEAHGQGAGRQFGAGRIGSRRKSVTEEHTGDAVIV